MKKIISAVALTALVAGAATADVKFNLNYRTQATLFSRLISMPDGTKTSKGDEIVENHNYWFKNGKGYADDSDTVSVVASNEYAGVTVRIDPYANSGDKKLNQYSAYIRLGSFEVGAGVYKDGLYIGDYQLKNDLDDSFLGGETAAAYKLGTMFEKSITSEMDNISSIGGNQGGLPAGYLQWKGNLGDSTVTATGSLIGLGTDDHTFDKDNTIASGFGFRLNAKFDSFQGQFVFKQANDAFTNGKLTGLSKYKANEIRAASLHVLLLDLVPNTKITVGGAAGWLQGDLTEANLDLRARYADGPLSVTFMTNISHATNNYYGTPNPSKHVGAYGLNTNEGKESQLVYMAISSSNFSHDSNQKYATAMWNFLGASYKLNETFTAFMFAGDLMNLQDSWAGIEAFAAPGIKIYAGGKSAISAFARFGWSHLHARKSNGDDYEKDGEGPDFAVIVPIIMRVRL